MTGLNPYAKAVQGFIWTFVAAVVQAYSDGQITSVEWVLSVSLAVAGGASVWAVKNTTALPGGLTQEELSQLVTHLQDTATNLPNITATPLTVVPPIRTAIPQEGA